MSDALPNASLIGFTGTPIEQNDAVLLEKYEVRYDLMYSFDRSKWMTGTSAERLGLLPASQEHVLQQEDGKARFTKVVTDISRDFGLCAPHDNAIRLRGDIAFFQALRTIYI